MNNNAVCSVSVPYPLKGFEESVVTAVAAAMGDMPVTSRVPWTERRS